MKNSKINIYLTSDFSQVKYKAVSKCATMALEKNVIQQTEDVGNPGLQVKSLLFFLYSIYTPLRQGHLMFYLYGVSAQNAAISSAVHTFECHTAETGANKNFF